jgi:hypothetical protein
VWLQGLLVALMKPSTANLLPWGSYCSFSANCKVCTKHRHGKGVQIFQMVAENFTESPKLSSTFVLQAKLECTMSCHLGKNKGFKSNFTGVRRFWMVNVNLPSR